MSKSPRLPSAQAALDGAREVAAPVFVATLTFAVVFLPIAILSGMARYLFAPWPLLPPW